MNHNLFALARPQRNPLKPRKNIVGKLHSLRRMLRLLHINLRHLIPGHSPRILDPHHHVHAAIRGSAALHPRVSEAGI